jgi:shikimate kinase
VYLETSIEQQAERAGRTRHRPLLHGADPQARLQELMRAREPLYCEVADLRMSTDRRRVRSVAERIASEYRAWLRRPATSANG